MAVTLRQALLDAIKGRRLDETRVDAILDVLGLNKNDMIVNDNDVALVVAWTQQFGPWDYSADTWDDEDMDDLHKAVVNLVKLLPPDLLEDE